MAEKRKFNNRSLLLNTVILPASLGVLFLFQNCSPGFEVHDSLSLNSIGLNTSAPNLSVLAPLSAAAVNSSQNIRGTCQSDLPIYYYFNSDPDSIQSSCMDSSYVIPLPSNLSEGSQRVTLSQMDENGQRSEVSLEFLLDNTPPAVSITSPANNALAALSNLNVAGSCETGSPVSISGESVSASVLTDCVNSSFAAVVILRNNNNGLRSLIVSQADAAENTGEEQINLNVNISSNTPQIEITAPAANYLTNQNGLTLTGRCVTGLNVNISGTGILQNVVTGCQGDQFTAQIQLTAGDGVKNVIVAQTNASQLTGQASRNFRLDQTAPLITIMTPAEGSQFTTGATIGGACEGNLPLNIFGPGINQSVTMNCNNALFQRDIVFSDNVGTKVINVSQTDAAGNQRTVSRSFEKILPPSLDGPALYAVNCASCHSTLENSTKRGADVARITAGIREVPQMSFLAVLPNDQLQAIADALTGANSTPPPQAGFLCTPGTTDATPMTKLTNREFTNSLFSILDSVSTNLKNDSELNSILAVLPTDAVQQDRNTYKEQSLLVQQSAVNRKFDAAFRAGELIANANLTAYPNTGGCLGSTSLSQICHQNFVREFASRSFRQNLSNADAAALSASLWESGSSKTDQLIISITSLLSRPEHMYKAYDQGRLLGPGQVELNADELAAKLAFFITGAPPDATLRNLANSGQILQPNILSEQTDRLLQTAGAREMIRRLFRESYGYEVYDTFRYPASFLNGASTDGLQDAMTSELDHYFVNVVLTQRGSFNDLMTSRVTSLQNASLASIYGVSTGATLLPTERAGFLNRAAMLTKRSGPAASPIKRGLKVLEHVLCGEVPDPPPSAPTSVPDVPGETLTTRERVHRATEVAGTSCVSCHAPMNNLGYPFEGFDSLGRSRTMESIFDTNGLLLTRLPVDTRAQTIEVQPPQSVGVAGSSDLVQELANSQRAKMCFVKQLKRFEARVVPTAASNCQMNESLQALENNGTVIEAIRAMVMSSSFRLWNY